MKIAKNTVVSLTYTLKNTDGEIIEELDEPLSYLHGGYAGFLPKIEEALEGKEPGYKAHLYLEPEDAFGDYDADLLRIEPREKFPPEMAVGMQFEGLPEEEGSEFSEEDQPIYTVTDIVEDKVVLDGNHPLAGMALRFAINVIEVREATQEEIDQEQALDGDNNPFTILGVDGEDDEEDEDDTDIPLQQPTQRTLH